MQRCTLNHAGICQKAKHSTAQHTAAITKFGSTDCGGYAEGTYIICHSGHGFWVKGVQACLQLQGHNLLYFIITEG